MVSHGMPQTIGMMQPDVKAAHSGVTHKERRGGGGGGWFSVTWFGMMDS